MTKELFLKAHVGIQVGLVTMALVFGSASYVLAELLPTNVTNLPLANGLMATAVSGKYLYTVGSEFRIFDISNPASPNTVSTLNIGIGYSVSISENYAFVTGASGVTIFDISEPTNPLSISQISGAWESLAIVGPHVFLAGNDGTTNGVFIFDISNPLSPVKIGYFFEVFPNAVSIAASAHYAYLALNWSGVSVWDVSSPAQPKHVGSVPAGGSGYAFDVVLAGNNAYVAASTNGLLVYDISNPTNPVIVANPMGMSPGFGFSAADYGNYVFDYWGAEFLMFNVTDPTNSSVVYQGHGPRSFDFFPHKMAFSCGYAYFPTGEGLSIWSLGIQPPPLSISRTSTNSVVLNWPTPTGAFSVQQSPGLNPANWVTLTNKPVVVGSQNQLTLPAPTGSTFYRLVLQ